MEEMQKNKNIARADRKTDSDGSHTATENRDESKEVHPETVLSERRVNRQ